MRILLIFCLSLASISFAQQNNWCGTDAILNQLKADHPEFSGIVHESMVKAATGKSIPNKATLVVPVVVHVIHDNGIGNISDEQIQDGLNILNQDYNRTNPDAGSTRNTPSAPFQAVAGDMNIEFKLAKIDPQGNCTNGIVRVNAPSLTYNANDDCKYSSNGGSDQWDMNRYLNIWVVNSIENNGGQGIILGYAYLPYWPSGTNFGILIRNDSFGTIETAQNSDGRTLTHEMGHLLGLQHIFDPGPSGPTGCHTGDCNQNGDYSCDTPPQQEANWSCSPTWNSCSDVPQNDAFGYDVVDQIENYMSYNYCQNMFSMDQVNIMQQNFVNIDFMADWVTPANVAATGLNAPEILCKADFEAYKTLVCNGDSVFIMDRSFHNPSGWIWSISGTGNVDWQFVNGTNATSQDAYIQFLNPGMYSITLTSSDGTNSDNETKANYIKVLPEAATIPFWEGFENISNLASSQWTILNSENNNTFQIDPTQGHSGNQCVKLNNYGQLGSNTDELIAGPADLSGIDPISGTVTLSFRYAYRKRLNNDVEWLKVFITKDCGDNWIQRKTLQGNSLSNVAEFSPWTPNGPEDWVTIHMTNITSDFFVNNFRYKFEFEGNNGNNFYLDDINIYPGSPSNNIVLGLNPMENIVDLVLYPNPTANEANLSFTSMEALETDLLILDITGKVIQHYPLQITSGKNLVSTSMEHLAKGTYFLQLGATGAPLKVVVE